MSLCEPDVSLTSASFQTGVVCAVQRQREDGVQAERLPRQRHRHGVNSSHPLQRREHEDRFDPTHTHTHIQPPAVSGGGSSLICCVSLWSRRGPETHLRKGLFTGERHEEKRPQGRRGHHGRTISGRGEAERRQAAARRYCTSRSRSWIPFDLVVKFCI